MSTLTTVIQPSFGSPSHSNQRRKRNKRIQIGKGEVKLSLFADDMILYRKNPKDATIKLLELINEFGKVAGCTEISWIPIHKQRKIRKRN